MQLTRSIEALRVVDDVVEAPARHRRNRSTVGWTRHTLGAIEAGRDGRRELRGPIRYRTAPVAAAIVLRPDFAADRWADEGGSFAPDAAAAVVVAIRR